MFHWVWLADADQLAPDTWRICLKFRFLRLPKDDAKNNSTLKVNIDEALCDMKNIMENVYIYDYREVQNHYQKCVQIFQLSKHFLDFLKIFKDLLKMSKIFGTIGLPSSNDFFGIKCTFYIIMLLLSPYTTMKSASQNSKIENTCLLYSIVYSTRNVFESRSN